MARRGLWIAFVVVIVVRGLVLAVGPALPHGPWLQLGLDAASLVALAAASVAGGIVGSGFGSTTGAFVAVLIPVAALGAGAEMVGGRAFSDFSGRLALVAVGAGLGTAALGRSERFDRMLVASLGVGAWLQGVRLLSNAGSMPVALAAAVPYAIGAGAAVWVDWKGRRTSPTNARE